MYFKKDMQFVFYLFHMMLCCNLTNKLTIIVIIIKVVPKFNGLIIILH